VPLDLRRELVEQVSVRARIDLTTQQFRGGADGDPGHFLAQALAGAGGVEVDLLMRRGSQARCWAWSMICVARSRASRMMASALPRASVRDSSPFSAAASPFAILRERSSIGPRIIGHTYFIVNQMSVMNTSICTMSVRLMFTVVVSYSDALNARLRS
jgi:hypothetical protein